MGLFLQTATLLWKYPWDSTKDWEIFSILLFDKGSVLFENALLPREDEASKVPSFHWELKGVGSKPSQKGDCSHFLSFGTSARGCQNLGMRRNCANQKRKKNPWRRSRTISLVWMRMITSSTSFLGEISRTILLHLNLYLSTWPALKQGWC